MLDLIRSNTQSLGVKIAFGVIILVFVFWGIGSLTDTGPVNVVGMVNDQPITFQQYEMAYRNAEEAASRNNPRSQWSDEEKRQLGNQVFNSLVSELLIKQEAEKNHISVSPYELRLAVDTIPAFQNDQGKFDPEVYKRVLAQQRQTPGQFEDTIRNRILQEKVLSFVTGGMWVDSMEPRVRFNFLRQRRVLEYVFISDADSTKDFVPSDADIAKFYEEKKNDYAIPRKADISYIAINPATLVKPESISDDEVKKWYDAHSSRFVEPKRVEVSHILVPLAPGASDEDVKKAQESVAGIQNELSAGEDFAKVADAHNGPKAGGPGGSVGWIEPGVTVPEFEKVAFETPKGSVSAPFRSQFGFHILKVTDVKEGGTKSLAEASAEIRTMLATDKGKAEINEVLDALIEDNILGKPMQESAAKYGLSVAASGLLSKDELVSKLSVKDADAELIVSTGKDHPVDTPIEAGDNYLIARVTDTAAATFRPLDEVKADVSARIRSERGIDAGKSQLEAMLKEAASGTLPEAWKSKVKESEPATRDGAFQPFEPQAELSDAVFSSPSDSWLSQVFQVATKDGKGVLACRVKKVIEPEDSEWQQFESIMTTLSQRERSDGLYQAFMQDLSSKSVIKVMNRDAIDRKNM